MKHLLFVTATMLSMAFLTANSASATGVIVQTGSYFNGTALTTLNVLITVGGLTGGATPLPNQNGTAQWYAPGGAAAGGAVNVTTPANAVLAFPTNYPIPAAAAPAGGAINFDFPNNPTNVTGSPKITWKYVFFTWLFSPFSIDPTGMPGSGPQTWRIVGSPALSISDPLLGIRNLNVTASNFDLSYTPLGNGVYSAAIDDTASYIQLSDGTLITLPDGSDFGTFTYQTSDTGTFDLSELGLTGTFDYNAGTNFTTAAVTGASTFDSPTIAVVTPEPASARCVACGLLCLIAIARRARSQGNANPGGRY